MTGGARPSKGQHLAAVVKGTSVLPLQLFGEERPVDELLRFRMYCCEEVQFALYGLVIEADSVTEFLEVLAADLADIGKLHPFFEKPFVKGEYPVVDQMQRSVDEVVGRSQAVFIAGVDQREIFQVGIVIERDKVEQHKPEETQQVYAVGFYVAADYVRAVFVAGPAVFVVSTAVGLCQAHQGGEILLPVFAPAVDVKSPGNIGSLVVLVETQSVGSGLMAQWV